jgi:hypothetical protein
LSFFRFEPSRPTKIKEKQKGNLNFDCRFVCWFCRGNGRSSTGEKGDAMARRLSQWSLRAQREVDEKSEAKKRGGRKKREETKAKEEEERFNTTTSSS